MPLDRRQWRIHRYIANAKNDVPFSAIGQCNINRSAILQIPNSTNWQYRSPLDHSQLRTMKTAAHVTISDEYWCRRIDADAVFAVVPYVPKP